MRQWAFCVLKGSPGGRAYFNALCASGIGHQAALRQVGNRLVGILHDCLKTRTLYDERTAWEHHLKEAAYKQEHEMSAAHPLICRVHRDCC